MKYKIQKAVVIGSGTMGGGIAALLANVGIPVTLLDIVPSQLTSDEEKKGLGHKDRQVRDRIAREGLDRAIKSRPASFFTPEHAELVKIGNLEDDFEEIARADWVIEVIVENLKIKQQLMQRIDAIRQPHTIISTNTSGIPVGSIAEGLSAGFRQHFLGTHFFNPPRYLKLLEIIPTLDTLPEVVKFINRFGERRLGKGIVPAKDTPNFIANRIAFGSAPFALDYIMENGYTVEEVDAVTGPPIGNPKTATFRLIDLVGIDIWEHVGKNLAPLIPNDLHAQKYLQSERVNALIGTLVSRGALGNKSRQGFYKEVRTESGDKEFWSLNLQTLEYQPPQKVRFESVGKVKDIEKAGERIKLLIAADDRAGQLVRALTFQSLAYASERIPEIADTPKAIDDAVRWGFNREAGPFETWDCLGVGETILAMKSAQFPPAPWVEQMLATGHPSFYQYAGEIKVGVYNPSRGEYQKIERPAAQILLPALKTAGKVLKKNPSASVIDFGDGVVGVELHTKMNVFDTDMFEMITQGLDIVDRDYDGMVIGVDTENFSAGANLFLIVMYAQNGQWDEIDLRMHQLQEILSRIRYSHKPVVVAPCGMALAGGCEMVMSASRVVATGELYTGLVEIAMGLIPAGTGTKEMMRRVLNPAMRTKGVEPLPILQRLFEQIGMAKVSMSAEEARQMGILSPCDRIVMNRDFLLTDAKQEVLNMVNSGYIPPLPEKIYAAGRDAHAAMLVGIHMMKEGGYITEYEGQMASRLASVLTGGDISSPAWVDESYILDLEREVFLWLVGNEKTRERIWTFLQSGKRIRN